MFKSNTKNNLEFYSAILIIVVIQVILMFQGFDVCDDGFVLTSYQQIFNSPSSVEYNFVYWLSSIIGGLWYKLYEDGGILWFRVLAVIVNTSTFIIAYKTLKPFMNKRLVLIGLAMVLFANNYGFLTFYHNHITAFLAVLSMYLLFIGLTKQKSWAIVLSGFIIAINVFSRIPNITLFVFILAIPFVGYLNNQPFSKSIRPLLQFLLGSAIGFVAIYLVLSSLNQLEIMKNALFSLVDLGKTEGSTHNVSDMLIMYIHNYLNLIIKSIEVIALIVLILGSMLFVKASKFIKYIIYGLGFISVILFFKVSDIYTIYAMSFIGTLGVLVIKQKSYEIKLIAFLALLMLLFLPLGSGGGISSSGYMCIWLATPLFFHLLTQFENFNINYKTNHETVKIVISANMLRNTVIVLVLSYFIAKAYNVSNEAYFDEGSRFNKTFVINNKLANGIYTTQQRAEIINDLLVNLDEYVEPDDYLFAYDNIPMVHFLTETKPYMYNPWVWIYDGHSFEKNIARAEKEIGVLPIIVQQKFDTVGSFSQPITNYMSESQDTSVFFDKRRVVAMNAFIKRNNYEIVWSNPYFNIYKSNKK